MIRIPKSNKRYYIETYGCTSNSFDSKIIESVLRKHGFLPTTIDNSDIIIVNTCGVKEQTENKIKRRLRELSESYRNSSKKLIITGCLPFIDKLYLEKIKRIVPNYYCIIHPSRIEEIGQILENYSTKLAQKLSEPKKSINKAGNLIDYRPNKITGIIPISEGCRGNCSYCCVKNARGKLQCFDHESILDNSEHQLKQGIKQLYLTSQDCSLYEEKGVNLSTLVKNISQLAYDFFIRIGMINPLFLKENFDQLIEIFNAEKVYHFLHVPIQAGSNRILKAMNRRYTTGDILSKLNKLKSLFPYISISTDIICGFPTETEYDFYRTINLVKFLKPEILNISKFTPRPGTIAKKMEQVNSRTIKERSILLSKLFRDYLQSINEKWMNWEGKVLILHKGNYENQAFGRNFAYKNVFVDNYQGRFGEFVNAKIYKIDGLNLYGLIKST